MKAGIVEKAPDTPINKEFHIPHKYVVKEKAETTKLQYMTRQRERLRIVILKRMSQQRTVSTKQALGRTHPATNVPSDALSGYTAGVFTDTSERK